MFGMQKRFAAIFIAANPYILAERTGQLKKLYLTQKTPIKSKT